jgi:serine/threonine-protein kinase
MTHNASSDPLFDYLRSVQIVKPSDADNLTHWFDAGRRPGESLVEFLFRHGLIDRSARRTLELGMKGYVAAEDVRALWPTARLQETLIRIGAELSEPSAEAPRTTHSAVPIYSTVSSEEFDGPGSGSTPNPDRPSVGQRVGRCLLTEQLAEGGGGLVFRALHQGLNIPVAVKLLSPQRSRPEIRQRLHAEAQLLAQLDHPHIVRVLDYDASELPHLVLEFVDGPNLAELIRQAGAMRFDRALTVIRQAAEGLAAAEAIGILHRDVKPANILLNRRGVAKVADLGLAVESFTRSGAVPLGLSGTLPFMAAEQLCGPMAIDARADIYSLGVSFYQALTGRLPFRGRSSQELIAEIRAGQFIPPHQLVPGLTPDFSHVVGRMMANEPADRYPGYRELLEDLAELTSRHVGGER